ncbi:MULTISPECIES: hypothetical protein [Mesorhizobium]|uniref:hypothetical protein n=1 Tax=Mesorhizobium australicum TaxID=536018 RepID=UPI0033353F2F
MKKLFVVAVALFMSPCISMEANAHPTWINWSDLTESQQECVEASGAGGGDLYLNIGNHNKILASACRISQD